MSINIVLVEPKGALNIGSVARVMKNTGFSSLCLVNPAEYKNNEGFSMACNAADILLGAKVYASLKEAVKGSRIIVGTTRRKGRVRHPVLTMDSVLPKIISMAKKNTVSILFGREDKGLKNEEISLCDMLFEIPAHGDEPSLNLSHAVFAVCHALFRGKNPVEPCFTAAPKREVEAMHIHIEKVLRLLGYGDRVKTGRLLDVILRNLRKLLGRTSLMQKEVNMIRGIMTKIEEELSSHGIGQGNGCK